MVAPRSRRRHARSAEQLPQEALDDFRVFLVLVWKRFLEGAPDPTAIQFEIAEFLQSAPRKKVVMAMRGIGKTYIAATLAVWYLAKDCRKQIVVVSKKFEKAKEITFYMKAIIDRMPELAYLRPSEEDRSSYVAFDVAGKLPSPQPSVVALSIEAMQQGWRADHVIDDDVETEENSYTDKGRERISKVTQDQVNWLKKDGEIVFFGTPQHEESLYTHALPGRGYAVMAWPMEYPDADLANHLGGWLAPSYRAALKRDPTLQGRAADTRLDDTWIALRKSEGLDSYRLNNLLDTRATDERLHPLKLRNLSIADLGIEPQTGPDSHVWSNLPEFSLSSLGSPGLSGDGFFAPAKLSTTKYPWDSIVLTIDESAKGMDETAYAVVATLHGTFFLLASGGFVEGYSPKTLGAIADAAYRFRVPMCIGESIYGGGMYLEVLKPALRARFTPDWQCGVGDLKDYVHFPQMNKERRIISTIGPILDNHRLVVARDVVENDVGGSVPLSYRLFRQMSRITRTAGALAHEDRLEAVALALAFLKPQGAIKVDEELAERDEASKEDRLRLMEEVYKMRRSSAEKIEPRYPSAVGAFEDLDPHRKPSRERGVAEAIGEILGEEHIDLWSGDF